jgi:hypothetical protein
VREAVETLHSQSRCYKLVHERMRGLARAPATELSGHSGEAAPVMELSGRSGEEVLAKETLVHSGEVVPAKELWMYSGEEAQATGLDDAAVVLVTGRGGCNDARELVTELERCTGVWVARVKESVGQARGCY